MSPQTDDPQPSPDSAAPENRDDLAGEPSTEEAATESQKSYRTILEQEITTGLHELERPSRELFMSALSAGLDIGFSVLLIGVMLTLVDGFHPATVELLVANMYAVGFVFVIFGRSELFTEHTTLAVLPVLDGRATVLQLGRLWGIVYLANLVGITLFSAIYAWVGPEMGIVSRPVLGEIAHRMLDHPWWVILLSAVLAGWMMGLLSWLVTAARDTISQVFFVWLITASIGFAGLHHSIVGSGEVLVGLFAGQDVGWYDFGHFLLFATLGNTLGGTFFVALIKYAHAKMPDDRYRRPDLTRPVRPRGRR